MTIKVTFEYLTLEQAIVGLGAMLLPGKPLTTGPVPGVAALAAKTATKEISVKEPTKAIQELLTKHSLTVTDVIGTGKDGRITKADVENAIKARGLGIDNVSTPTVAAVIGTVEITKDTLRENLRKLNDAKGMQTCLDVLSRFGVQRISDIKENQYADFIKKVEEVLAGGLA